MECILGPMRLLSWDSDWGPQAMAAITRLHLHHHHHHHAFPIIKPSLLLSKLSHSPSFFPNFHSTPLRKFSLTPLLCSISDQPLQVLYLIRSFHTLVIFSLVPVKARKIEDSWRKLWTFSFLLVISQNRKKIKKKCKNKSIQLCELVEFSVLSCSKQWKTQYFDFWFVLFSCIFYSTKRWIS